MTPDQYNTDERLDAGIEKVLGRPLPGRVFFENLADHAAAQVELDVEQHDINSPGDRIVETYWSAVPAQGEVTVDATDHIQAGLIDYQDGTHTHADPSGGGLVRANAQNPIVFVVDAKGNRIEGGRVMVAYHDIELDTP